MSTFSRRSTIRRRSPAVPLAALAVLVTLGGCASGGREPLHHENLNAVLWTQRSAEADAQREAIYAAARVQLDRALADPSWTAALEQSGDFAQLPPAVILDVDETVLDNSPYQAKLIRDNARYGRETWDRWCNAARAVPVAGALEFCRYAHQAGVRVFYVTNRKSHLREATRRNLKRRGFPLDSAVETVLTRGEEGEKTGRRELVARDHRVLLLFGDNLADFAAGFYHGPADDRRRNVERHRGKWGTRWIVLPNPMYGDWERAPVDYAWVDEPEWLRAKRAALQY